jgi:energy-coupling factor transport system permease protein
MAEILAYVYKDGFFHLLHPVTKIVFIVVVSLMCIISTNPVFLFALVFVILLIAYLGKLYTEVIQQSRLIIMMSIVFIIITVITMPNGSIIGYLIPIGFPVLGGTVPVTWGAIEIGVILSLRFMILIYAFQIFIISTKPRDLVHTLEKMRMPIDYVLMFIIALRFIPTLQIEGIRIHEAQLARGYNPGPGFMGRIRSVAPIIVPLVSNALLRANVLGLTIDMRGYRTITRTHVREMELVFSDYAVMGSLVCIACGFFVLLVLQIM